MSVLLHGALGELKKRTLSLAAQVEELLGDSIKAFRERDAELANAVVLADERIDTLEVELEEECLKLLALYQPVATDLRFVVAVIKLNNDLERIADLAADLAERAATLAWQPPIAVPASLTTMPDLVMRLLRQSLDAVVNVDAALAEAVCLADDEVDALHAQTFEQVMASMERHPEQGPRLIQFLSISRHLERVADHCSNIAEDVIYLVEGRIVRHEVKRRAERAQTAAEDGAVAPSRADDGDAEDA